MDSQFTVFHRRRCESGLSSNPPKGLIWKTCLRDIVFSLEYGSIDGPIGKDWRCFQSASAYRFILEVICGLHSPILGETEVMGQFKKFLNTLPQTEYHLPEIFSDLIRDAKVVRNEHLVSIGAATYGSVIRQMLKNATQIDVIGSGQLVASFLPWVLKEDRNIRLFCRSIERGNERKREVQELKQGSFEIVSLDKFESSQSSGPIVVAAPVSDIFLARSILDPKIKVIDLRGGSAPEGELKNGQVISLAQIFNRVKLNAYRSQSQIAQAKKRVSLMAIEWSKQLKIRPQGWEDLCG